MERTFNIFPAIREEYTHLTQKVLKRGELTVEGKKLLKEYLLKMERFAVGVNKGVYDLSIINQMSGGLLINQYDNFICNYIKERKSKGASGTAYCEYEKLINDIRELRAKTAPNYINISEEFEEIEEVRDTIESDNKVTELNYSIKTE